MEKIGTYFKTFFGKSYFKEIEQAHEFQSLTESNKKDMAYRTGVFLSPASREDGVSFFNVLRCSSNLKGPTEAFKDVDFEILDKINSARERVYKDSSPFNHVLAQIYHNSRVNGKEKKARIKSHSDKTADMPPNALIGFCTFYDRDVEDESFLTKLRFRNKTDSRDIVDVVLHPNSALLIPLETNRHYTHETVPPPRPPEQIPTRMGYTIRSSNVLAKHDGKTSLLLDGVWEEMTEPTHEGVKSLKKSYADENMLTNAVIYDKFLFSLNKGDYLCPKF